LNYFPAFLNFDNVEILIVGGGEIAKNKLEQVLNFGQRITVISPIVCFQMQLLIEKFGFRLIKRNYVVGDIKNYQIAIIAIDNITLQKKIYDEGKKHNVLCNVVDSSKHCDFIFPSYIQKGDLTIAISTSGASPAFAKELRKFLQELIPNSIVEFLNQMRIYRKELPKGKKRMKFLSEIAQKEIKNWRKKDG